MFPGATRKAIEERIAKLKREAKAAVDPGGASVTTPRKRKNSVEDGDVDGPPAPKKKKTERLDRKGKGFPNPPERTESPVVESLYPLPKRGEPDTESMLSEVDSVIFCAERSVSGEGSGGEQGKNE
ncbi:hypothetical protein GP486_007301 [Trichoglossum hirsutum]|uniref:Uncharacterized protein n=1 Tax=Trichoglossum hirsutum TaxID=265104 RepID=A0A9P8IFR1_9PEZI|nr:hypothetical protein GP486_007301 [Trichoglossum hirsutum]